MIKIRLSKVASIALCSTLFFATFAKAEVENNNIVTKPEAKVRAIDAEKLAELAQLLKEAEEVLQGTNLSFVKDLGGIFDTIKGILKSVSTGTVAFDINTISTRIKLSIKLIQNIKVASESLYNKEQYILTKYGFAITGIILDTLNPLTSNSTLTYDLSKLDKVLQTALEGPDQGPDSIANTNKKEELAILLRSSRTVILNNLFHIKDYSKFNNFKKEISNATLIRLDPNKTVQEVNETIEKIKALKTELLDEISNLPDENIIASLAQKEELAKELRKARALKYTEFKGKSLDVKNKLAKVILRLTGVRLDINASVADVNNAKEELKNAIEEAKNSTDILASNDLRKKLLKNLHEARFLKFNVLSKKAWEVNRKLDKVIFSLNGLSINLFSTKIEVQNALEKLEKAVQEAKAAENL